MKNIKNRRRCPSYQAPMSRAYLIFYLRWSCATLHQGNSTLPIISSLQLSADLPLLLFWSYGTQNVICLHSVPLHFVSSLIIVALVLSFFLTPKMLLSIPLCVVTSLLVWASLSRVLSSDNNSIEVEMAIPHLVDNISC